MEAGVDCQTPEKPTSASHMQITPALKKVCRSSALKAPTFLPVCALLIALPLLAPSPLFLCLSLSLTHALTLPLAHHFSTTPPLSPPLAASLFCRFSPFSLSVHSSKENFIHFILISQMNPEGRRERWRCEKEGEIGNRFILVMAQCYWAELFDGWLLASHRHCLINE